MNLSKWKLLFDPSFGQDGSALDGDSVMLGVSAYNLAGAAKSLLRGDESGRIEVVGPTVKDAKAVLAAATILPGAGLGADRTSGVATITTSAAHGFSVGDVVVVAGVTDPTFDGTYVVESTPLTTTFTYTNAGSDTTSEGGTALDETKNPRPLLAGALDATTDVAKFLRMTGDDLKVVFSNTTIGVTGTFWPTVQPVSDNSGSLTVDFTGQYLDGAAWGAGSTGIEALAVRKDAAGPLSGVADGDFSPLQVDANGALKVSGTFSVSPGDNHVESAVHGIGDTGSWALSFRQDSLANQAGIADADYVGLKSNDRGALWVAPVGNVADSIADSENPVKVGTKVMQTLAAVPLNGDRANMISDMYRRLYVFDAPNRLVAAATVSVGLTAVPLPGTALAGRTRVSIQNRGNKAIFVGPAGVTVAAGTEVGAGGAITLEAGDQCLLYAISTVASQDVRVLELA